MTSSLHIHVLNMMVYFQIVLENYAFPGLLLIGTDSHTPNGGTVYLHTLYIVHLESNTLTFPPQTCTVEQTSMFSS